MRWLFCLFVVLSWWSALLAEETGWLKTAQIGPSVPIRLIEMSPTLPIVATAGSEPKVHIWDANDIVLLRTLEWHNGAVRKIKFMPDGERLVTSSMDNTIRIWDSKTGKMLLEIGGLEGGILDQFEISTDGELIYAHLVSSNSWFAVSTKEKTIAIPPVEIETDLCVSARDQFNDCEVVLHASQDGEHLYLLEGLGYRVLDAHTLEVLNTVILSKRGFSTFSNRSRILRTVNDVRTFVDQNGEESLILIYNDGRVESRNALTSSVNWTKKVRRHFDFGDYAINLRVYDNLTPNALSLTDWYNWISVSLDDGKVEKRHPLDDVRSNLVARLDENRVLIALGEFSAYSSEPGKIGIFDIAQKSLREGDVAPAVYMNDLEGASSAPLLAIGAVDIGAVRVIDLSTKEMVSDITAPNSDARNVAISGDGSVVAGKGLSEIGSVWHMKTGEVLHRLAASGFISNDSIQLADDGKWVAYREYAGEGLDIHLESIWNNDVQRRLKSDQVSEYGMVAASPDGSRIALSRWGIGVDIYDVESGKTIATLPLDSVGGVTVASPHANVFAAMTKNYEVVVSDWDGNEIARPEPYAPYTSGTFRNDLDVSNDGDMVAITGDSGRVCLLTVKDSSWDCFLQVDDNLASITFVDNDRYLAATGYGTTTYIFDVAKREQIMAISQSDMGGSIWDSRDGSATAFGLKRCVEVKDYEWRPCEGS